MIRRSATVAAPLKVSFPGGGMDGEETQTETAIREMFEEVGADITPVANVWHHVAPEQKLTLWGWLGVLNSYEVIANPDEVTEILWLTAEEIRMHPDIMPRTGDFLAALINPNRAS